MASPGAAVTIHPMAIRVLRVSFATALALALAYAVDRPLPYLAPVFAFMLCAAPGPPLQAKSFIGLLLLVSVTCGSGLLLIPMLMKYPAAALALIALGLFLSNYLVATKGQNMPATFLTAGLTLITAAGTMSFALALDVVYALLFGLAVAVVCQHIAHAIFPERGPVPTPPAPETVTADDRNWRALRATLVLFPPYLVALINPGMYLPLIMKSAMLGQQDSTASTRSLGREIVGSTFLAGCFAVLFWMGLKILPSLWMFFLWMLLFGLYFCGKLYGVLATRYPPSYWTNVVATLLILLGPAVADSENGNDVYKAFFVRLMLFVGVALYTWGAVATLEFLRKRSAARQRLVAAES